MKNQLECLQCGKVSMKTAVITEIKVSVRRKEPNEKEPNEQLAIDTSSKKKDSTSSTSTNNPERDDDQSETTSANSHSDKQPMPKESSLFMLPEAGDHQQPANDTDCSQELLDVIAVGRVCLGIYRQMEG